MDQHITNRKKQRCIYLTSLLGLVALVALDQLTKYAAVVNLKGQEPFVLWEGIFELSYLENRGAAFGVLQGKKIIFLFITILFLVLLIWFFHRLPRTKHFLPLHLISVLIGAGAIGNMIDRIWHNYVIDFFYFSLIDFPIFNVADIYVTVSCVLIIFFMLFFYKEEDWEQIFPSKKNRDNGQTSGKAREREHD